MLGYTAGPGYDMVTGLGSLDVSQFVEQWGSDFQVSVNPSALLLESGSSASADVQITRFANFGGPVNLTCSVTGSLRNSTCSITPQVSGNGAAVLSVSNVQSSAGAWGSDRYFPWGRLALVMSAGVLLVLTRRKTARLAGVAALCTIGVTSCGSGSVSSSITTAPDPTLNGSIVVSATSGVLQRSITVPVTISPGR
jgi:hypothetical protein